MARRLILDTGAVIAIERGTVSIEDIIGDDDASVAAITVAELLVGVQRSGNQHRDRRAARVDGLLRALPVIDYTARIARVHAELIAAAMTAGKPRGAHDLMIAATARATQRTLITCDAAADFTSLPGVDVQLLPPA